MRNRQIGTILLVLLVTMFSSSIFGQTEKGLIVGTVSDANGSPVANATITVTNLGNKTSQTYTTNGAGIYNVPFLDPGNYEVSASATGFSKAVVKDVVVSIGSRESVNIELKVGQISEIVDITGDSPLLQTENANVGQVITSQQLTDLPSSNRNIYTFLALDSTVNGVGVNSSNAEAFRVESGGTMSISGSRPSSITFKMDGQANTDPTFGTPTVTPSLDTVKEFQLQNNAYSAEFEGIAQVNIASKSGTNRFHGSLFEFAQNSFFQPRNPLAPLQADGKPGKNKLNYNQFGGTIGGPMWFPHFGEGGPVLDKDKTFFFFSYEGLRNNARGLAFARVMTQAERTGDFSASLGACITVGGNPVPQLNPNGTPSGNCVRAGQIFDPATTVANPLFNPGQAQSAFNPQFIRQPFTNNIIPSGRINPNATELINAVQQLPNFVSADPNINFGGPSGNNFVNNQYSIRIDHRLSNSDTVYGRYTWQNNSRDGELVLPYQQKDLVGKGNVFSSSWTHIFSTSIVNELRLGYVAGDYGDSITEIDPTQFGVNNTALNTLPQLLLTAGGTINYGGFSGSILETIQRTYQLSDNLSILHGRHNIKVGFKADHNRFSNVDRIASAGSMSFNGMFSVGNSSLTTSASRPNSMADFLIGYISSESLNRPNVALLRQSPWAVYFQDDWRLSDQLTINIGLRYELHQPMSEEHLGGRKIDLTGEGRLLVADPEIARLANSPLVVCCSSKQVVDTDKNDFAPRLGIAYRPFKSDSTVIRAGYGLFYTDTSQFFHWQYYSPFRGTSSFTPTLSSFTTPSATLNDPFPTANNTPPGGSGITIGIPAGVNPAAVNNQPVLSVSGIGPYETPLSHQWSIGVQREILKNMVLDVSYKGAKSANLPVQWFFNQPTLSSTPVNFQSLDPAANPYLRRQYDNFSITANVVANILEAEYRALTVKVEKRLSEGYGFLATYTWSRSVDQGAEVFTLGQNHAFLANNLDLDAGRGVSLLDIPHRFVGSGNYELPFGKGKPFLDKGGIVNALVGGWRLSGIFTMQSGQPFSPYLLTAAGHTNTGVSVVERGNFGNTTPFTDEEWKAALKAWESGQRLYIIRPDAIDLNYTGLGNIPRNAFRYLYTRRLDLSLAKVTSIGEYAKVELRFDMFNVTREILHHPVFHTQVAGANALTNAQRGSIPGRNIYFLPHTIQVGARITF